jgi:tetratricopeptide (TPR) repeat protein
MPEEWKALDEAEAVQRLEALLPERRQAEDLTRPIKELVEWGLLTPVQEDGGLTALSVHALVRDFCRDKQQGDTWPARLRDAAAFYTNFTKLMQREEKTQAAVWVEMEAFELLMEAEAFNFAAGLLINATPLLDRWGFGQYLEGQYRRLFDKELDTVGTAVLLHNFGIIFQQRGDYDKALEYYDRSLKLAEGFGDRFSVSTSLHQIGMIHQARGDYDKALEYYDRALKLAEEFGDRPGTAYSLGEVGNTHYLRGEYEKALTNYNEVLKISEELGDRYSIANSLGQIGMIHQARGDYGAALEYCNRTLKLSEEIGHRSGVSTSLHQIGMIHQARGDYDAALEYYDRSLKIAEELGDRSGVASTLGQIGKLLVDTEQYDKAFGNLLSALSIFIEMQSPYAGTVVNYLKELRAKWGEENFDAAWKEAAGGDVPDWLKK